MFLSFLKVIKTCLPVGGAGRYKLRTCKGFTLVEVMIALAVLVALSTFGFTSLFGIRESRSVRSAAQGINSVLQDARERSLTQADGMSWGVRFLHPSEDVYEYQEFFDAPFGVHKAHFLSNGVQFSDLPLGDTFDVAFQSVNGMSSLDKIISVASSGKGGVVGDVILRSVGFISPRLEKGVAGYWHFDQENGSVAYDASGLEGNGSISGAVWDGPCRAGGCLRFDGADDYVSGSFPHTFSSFSILGWVRLDGDGGNKGALWSGYDGSLGRIYARVLGSSRKPSFYTNPGGGEGTTAAMTALSDGWHHLAYVYDGISKKIYIDGVEDVSEDSPDLLFPLDSFEIGRSEQDGANVLRGWIDEPRVYDRALSSEEIWDRYNDLR